MVNRMGSGRPRRRSAPLALLLAVGLTAGALAAPSSAFAQADPDPDQDQVLNDDDNCPTVSNSGQENTHGLPDNEGDVCDDTDSDGVTDDPDTCPEDWNGGKFQTQNKDGDSLMDACDPADDLCPTTIDPLLNEPNATLENPSFEDSPAGDPISGWVVESEDENVSVIGEDNFAVAREGEQLLQLGDSQLNASAVQTPGANVLCQAFTIPDSGSLELSFDYNLFSYDITGADSFRFEATVLDTTDRVVKSVTRKAWGAGNELRSTGWQRVTFEFADDDRGETALLMFAHRADAQQATWAYVDLAAGSIEPPGVVNVADVDSDTATFSQQGTDDPLLLMPSVDKSDVTIPIGFNCPGTTAVDPTPKVTLFKPSGAPVDIPWAGAGTPLVIPSDAVASGDLVLLFSCSSGGSDPTFFADTLFEIVLYDPSGIVTDRMGIPIEGATVTLFRVPGWTASNAPDDTGTTKCQSNLSKAPGAPWDQPAPVDFGELANPGDGSIDPTTTTQQTNASGYYGWNVMAGCWFVTVTASGYNRLTSPVVGVPTAVTDLDLEMSRSGGGGGPSPSPSPNPTEGGGGEPPVDIPTECAQEAAEVCGTEGDDNFVIDGSDDLDGDGNVTIHTGDGNDDVCIDESAGLSVRALAGEGDDNFEIAQCGTEPTPVTDGFAYFVVTAARPSSGLFFGGPGSDSLRGGSARDLLNGGVGVDRLVGRLGRDTLKASRGKDILISGDGSDWLFGGKSDDGLKGGPGPDQLLAGDGDDRCVGGPDKDLLVDCESKKWSF